MTDVIQLQQDPHPGTHHIRFRGDLLTVALALAEEEKGRAWLRTNIGHGITTKRETIHTVERAISPQAEDWFDIPMTRVDERNFRVTLPLHEPGRFEGKCFFLKEGEENPVWPEGGNLVLHVKTARACSANIIYNAFVRQFGPNKEKETVGEDPDRVLIEALEEKDYTVIPPSGKLRDLKKELDFIVGELGCRILLLLPIHPIPTTYARMGRFGSPYAALNFYSVAPGLASFDQYSTPLEQFIELVDGVHERGALIMLDIAINHTGWAANLHETHPEWLTRDSAGEIQVPGAWGVFWEDLTKLDYGHQELWRYMTDVFLTWCARGVDGFRCDAGYMIPLPAWRYIVASVRARYPETVFLLEGLGGGIDATRDILDKANFDWAYSELFQNYDRGQIEHYLPDAIKLTEAEGGMIHFAETHDNPRLAATSVRYAMMRTALCALFSVHGGFGFANGVEWFARDKINVHQATSLNWGAPDNQVARIRELNTLLKTHPVFFDGVELRLIQKGSGNHVVLLRHHPPTGKRVIVLVNLDMENQGLCAWDHGASGVETTRFRDLLHHEEVAATLRDAGREAVLPLDPGQVRCLTPAPRDAAPRDAALEDQFASPRRVVHQFLAAKVCEILVFLRGVKDVGDLRMKEEVEKLSRDPREYCLGLNPRGEERRVTLFRWPEDRKREVMVPPGYFLMVVARSRFRARLLQWERVLGCEDGLPMKDGSRFALFVPRGIPQKHRRVKLELSVYTPGDPRHVEGRLLFLSDPSDARVRTRFGRSYVVNRNLMMLGVNGRGGMLSAFAEWGKLASKYDALIAANLDPRRPEDRWIMLARCRVWLVFQDYSKELNLSCLESFTLREDSFGSWEYRIPVGRGRRVRLMAAVRMS
ncbi:MAG: glycogen debranching protein, partial [Desulfobacterales bacterium]|nr:glycogen debranching protein [Desulfobacterales bacterium]